MSLHRMNRVAIAAVLAATVLAGCATPEEAREENVAAEEHTIVAPDEIDWQEGPPSVPAGARFAVLSGDPAAEGPFTMRLEMPAAYRIPAHTHLGTEHVTILSGSAFVGTGDEIDTASATSLPTGSFFVMPPDMQHYFFTGDEPVVLQLHGQGPWGIEYVDPEDDPRNG